MTAEYQRPLPAPGARNGSLVALRQIDPDRPSKYDAPWEVVCERCGEHLTMNARSWRRNKIGMCCQCKNHALLGRRFGRLTVVEYAGKAAHGDMMWRCRCDCGGENTVAASMLNRGKVKSCGCLRRRMDLAGKHVGKLIVLRSAGTGSGYQALWECRCECGRIVIETSSRLCGKPGIGVRSCGCDGRRHIPRKDQTLFDKWRGMRAYPHWARWDRYATFRNWALRTGYNPNCTIARIDPTQPYNPANAYWLDNQLKGTQHSQPNIWKPMSVYCDGELFGSYRSCTAAAEDVQEEEQEHSVDAVRAALRKQAQGRATFPYLGRWTAEYVTAPVVVCEPAA